MHPGRRCQGGPAGFTLRNMSLGDEGKTWRATAMEPAATARQV
jgi:hypothetical protein